MGSISPHRALRIGVDVGGTNTDAVILDLAAIQDENRGVLAAFKTPTTSPNITDGIATAVSKVLEQAGDCTDEISCLIVGTTHFLNAVVERDSSRLSKVAVIRLSKSYTKNIPPFSDFPPELTALLRGYIGYTDGGLHIDGSQEAPISEEQIIQHCNEIQKLGITSIVISGIFLPIDRHFHQEHRIRDIIQKRLPGVDVVCSSEVSNIGLLERENASILNAAILKFARRTIMEFRKAMLQLNLDCSLFISQNDGTVIDAASAAKLPIKTFSSGPTNSMRGAAYLGLAQSGQSSSSTIVVDVGGTTTDCGVLLPSGYPRAAPAYVNVAGVDINFPMPHLESIGLGGGSLVRDHDSHVTVGPDSVGYELTTRARVFGGDALTTTDIAVAAGNLDAGDKSRLTDVSSDLVNKTQQRIKKMLERVIDRLKISPAPLPVLLVGGGSVICPTSLEGVSEVIVPRFHSYANAVGAAIARVGGSIDMIFSTDEMTMSDIIAKAKSLAGEEAIAAGADPGTLNIVEIDAIPIAYVSGQVRVIVKAVGDLSSSFVSSSKGFVVEAEEQDIAEDMTSTKRAAASTEVAALIDFDTYRPKIAQSNGKPEWYVSEIDLAWLRDGCYILGCAGGGSPKAEFLKLRDELRAGHTLRIVDSSHLAEDATVYWGGMMGSPATSIERLNSGECSQAIADLMELLGHENFDVIMGLEIGGANGLEPLLIGSSNGFNRPVVDADWMGRAYPTYWQTTIAVHQPNQLTPCVIASGNGQSIAMLKTSNDEIVDRALRASCAEMGSRVGMACKPTTTDKVRRFGVLNTYSLAWRIGRCVARAQQENTVHTVAEQIIDAVGGPSTAKILFRGKIVGVERRLYKGHSHGHIVIEQMPEEEQEAKHESMATAQGGTLTIPFKNENIYAKHTAEDSEEKYVAAVPDLIAVLDSQSGLALGVPEYRYGLIVTVLAIACSPRWTETKRGLEYGGPSAFGYDIPYEPIGVYVEPKSVILEYAD